MIIKKDHPVQASRVNKARNPQQIKLENYKAWLKEPKHTRGKYPPRKEGERNG